VRLINVVHFLITKAACKMEIFW